MLVATPGGHLLELLALSEAWRGLSRVWVTADRPHSRFALEGERVYFVPPQRPRRFRNVVRNLFRARHAASATLETRVGPDDVIR